MVWKNMLKLTVRLDNHGLAALGWQNAQLPSLTFFLPTCEHLIYLKLKVCRRVLSGTNSEKGLVRRAVASLGVGFRDR